ncbi:MAG: hypothetical protein J6U70_00115 [Bacteroidales bacterium]|nr:hypothetical protein [Bacteroidales bacterium]
MKGLKILLVLGIASTAFAQVEIVPKFVPMNANGFVGRGQFVYYVLTSPDQ